MARGIEKKIFQNEKVRGAFFGPLSKVQKTMGLFFIVFWGLMRAGLMGSWGFFATDTRDLASCPSAGQAPADLFFSRQESFLNFSCYR